MDELRNAIIRFQIDITDKELKVFLAKLDEEGKGYITQSQFIHKFWSAYTYEDVFNSNDTQLSGGTPSNPYSGVKLEGISEKIKRVRMFSAIQKKVRMLSESCQ